MPPRWASVVRKSPATQVAEPAAGQLIGAKIATVQLHDACQIFSESFVLIRGHRPADCKRWSNKHQRNVGNISKYLEIYKPPNSLHLSSCYYLLSFSGRGHIAVQRFMPLLFFGAYLFTVFRAHLWQKCFCNTTVVFYNFDSNSYRHIMYGCWLVVSTPLENISQLGWLFPIYGKMFQTTNQGWMGVT